MAKVGDVYYRQDPGCRGFYYIIMSVDEKCRNSRKYKAVMRDVFEIYPDTIIFVGDADISKLEKIRD